jgi:hypothetical protein
MTKLRYDYNLLKNICQENSVMLLLDYKDKYITRDTRIIGKCILCDNSFDKSLNKLYKQKNFGCKTCAKKLKFERIKTTMIEKYGVEYAAKSNIFKDKIKETNLEKYGVEYGFQSEIIKEKIRVTNLEKYGVEYGLQTKEVKEKRRITNLEKYGFESPLQREDIKEKCKQSNLIKYGVEHPSQNKEIMEKMTKNMYKSKEYTLPSGNKITIQGYENFALDDLLEKENICENDIITGCKNVPTIWYIDENEKKHRHYVDIYISSQNRCIEVKSTWTAKMNNNAIFLKQAAAKELGYKYEIWIYDNKGTKIYIYK